MARGVANLLSPDQVVRLIDGFTGGQLALDDWILFLEGPWVDSRWNASEKIVCAYDLSSRRRRRVHGVAKPAS